MPPAPVLPGDATTPPTDGIGSSISRTSGRLPLLQRLQHAISRGDLAGLILAVGEAEAAAAAASGPRLVLSKHLLFSGVRAGHPETVAWLLDRHAAQQQEQQQQGDGRGGAATLVDNRGE